MKKNKLIMFSVVSLLGLGSISTISEVTNVIAQAKTAKVDKKKHIKKKLSKHKKLLQEIRDKASHTDKHKEQDVKKTDRISNGYNYTMNTITDYNQYSQTVVYNMLKLINNYRTANGLSKLSLDNILTAVANKRAQQNNQWWNESWFDGHNDQNGNFIAGELAKKAGITTTYIGENAGGTPGDGALENPIDASNNQFQKWVNEGPTGGHYQNMMDPKYTRIGIGVYMNPDKNPDIYGGYDEVYSN